jgi:hypothetical protein
LNLRPPGPEPGARLRKGPVEPLSAPSGIFSTRGSIFGFIRRHLIKDLVGTRLSGLQPLEGLGFTERVYILLVKPFWRRRKSARRYWLTPCKASASPASVAATHGTNQCCSVTSADGAQLKNLPSGVLKGLYPDEVEYCNQVSSRLEKSCHYTFIANLLWRELRRRECGGRLLLARLRDWPPSSA